MTVILHPPYSPDLTTCDFLQFSKMKLKRKGPRFDAIAEIQTKSQRVLDTLTEKDFQWDRCLRAGENYFEDDVGR
jgi:hypothetical protein